MENELIQSGSIVVGSLAIVTLIIRELFGYLKSKNGNGGNRHDASILQELQKMNSNHLHSLEAAIRDGNDRLVETIHNDNTRMIEILGEIKGGLKR